MTQDSQERFVKLFKNRCRINIRNCSVRIRKKHATNITMLPGILHESYEPQHSLSIVT